MNAKRPRLVSSGGNHQRSVRSVRSGICARVGVKAPIAGRFAVGAHQCDHATCYLVEGTQKNGPLFLGGLGYSVPVTSDTLIVDIAPKFAIVLGVGDGDFLAGLRYGGPVQGLIQRRRCRAIRCR